MLGAGAGAGASGLKAGISQVQGDAKAAKSVNISINSLMSGNIVFQTTNIRESAGKIKEAVNQALVEAVRDFELVA